METRKRKFSLVWPVILIGVGVVFLLDNLGVVDWNVGMMLYRTWPLILVAFGVDILIGRRSGAGDVISLILVLAVFVGGIWLFNTYGETFSDDLVTHQIDHSVGGATNAEVRIDFGVGELHVGGDPNTGSLITGSIKLFDGQDLIDDFELDGNTAKLRLGSENHFFFPNWTVGDFFDSDNIEWDINLTESIPFDLNINAGVGYSVIDLANLSLTSLDIDTGVGETTVYLPSSGDFEARVSGGVGEINIYIPTGTSIVIRVDTGLGGVSFNGDFNRAGSVYLSENYSSNGDHINLVVNGGVGSINIYEIDR